MLTAQGPMISVIVPVYNMAEYVEKCLDSILSADCQNLELIVVDDGSTDDSLKICQRKLAGRSDVKILTQTNAGQGAARNNGLSVATGKYVLFVDSDDAIDSQLFNLTLPVMDERRYDFISFGLDFVNLDGVVSHTFLPDKFKELRGRAIFEHAMMDEEIYSSPVNKLYLREFLDRHGIRFPEVKACEDIYFSRVLAYNATATAFVAKVLYHALIRPGSTTRNVGENFLRAALDVLAREKSYLQDNGAFPEYRDLYLRHYAKQVAYIFYVLAYRAKDLQVLNKSVRFARDQEDFRILASSGNWGEVGPKYRLFLAGSRFPVLLRTAANFLALFNVKPY